MALYTDTAFLVALETLLAETDPERAVNLFRDMVKYALKDD